MANETELFDQLLNASQESISQRIAADCAKSESGTAEASLGDAPVSHETETTEESSSPLQHRKTTSWWAPILKAHLVEHATDPVNVKPVTLLSACAGSCAEAEVLKDTWA